MSKRVNEHKPPAHESQEDKPKRRLVDKPEQIQIESGSGDWIIKRKVTLAQSQNLRFLILAVIAVIFSVIISVSLWLFANLYFFLLRCDHTPACPDKYRNFIQITDKWNRLKRGKKI